MTIHIWITPEVGLALVALTSTESLLTGTLSIVLKWRIASLQKSIKIPQSQIPQTHRIALFVNRSDRIAIARLTSLSAGDLPVVLDALIAVLSTHIGQTRTLSGNPVAMLHRLICPQHVTIARPAVLFQCVSVVPVPTELTMVTFRIVQTLQALTRLRVAVTLLIQVHVVAAIARLADSTRSFRISVVVVRADVALGSRIALVAQANHVIRLRIQQTLISVRMAGSNRVRTAARPTTNLRTQQRITVVTLQAPVAPPAMGKVLALDALSGLGVTRRRMSITLAHLTVREVPEPGLTLVTLPPVGIRMTTTLTGYQIAIVVLRSDTVAVASLAPFRPEAVRSRGTLVTLPAHHVGLARTVSAELFAFLRRRTGRVAFAG